MRIMYEYTMCAAGSSPEGDTIKIQSIMRYFGGFVALALALSMGSMIGFAQSADSAKISDLLVQVKKHAALAQDDATKLESYAMGNLHWKTHAQQLDSIRGHVNELGLLNKQLSDLRDEGSPWQQTAIDQIDTQLREMVDLLTATINHLRDNQTQVHLQPYRNYMKANYELTSDLAKMIEDYVDYDQAKSKTESLEQQLNQGGANGGF